MSLTNSAKFSLGFSTELRWDWGAEAWLHRTCVWKGSLQVLPKQMRLMFYYVISASNFSGTTFFLATLLQVVPAYHKASLQLYFTICVCTRIAHCPIWTTIRQSQFVSHRNFLIQSFLQTEQCVALVLRVNYIVHCTSCRPNWEIMG